MLIFIIFAKFNFEWFKKFKFESSIIISIIVYAMFRDLFAYDKVYFFRFSAWYFQSFVFGLFLIYVVEIKLRRNLFEIIYWACFLGSMLTFLLIMVPPFDNWYRGFVILTDFDKYETFVFRYRNYGMSENLSFTYSFVMGFFGAYTLTIIKKNWFLIIPFLFFVIAVSFNARIGFIPLIVITLFNFLSFKGIKNIFIIIILGLIITLIVDHYSPEIIEKITLFKEWKLGLFYQISDIFFKTNYLDSGTILDFYFKYFIVLPKTFFEWIFGTGKTLFGAYGQSSDIGYVLQLYYGGLIFLILILTLMFYMSFRLYKNLGFNNWFFVLFITAIFLLNVKGFVFAATPGGRLLFLLYYYFLLKKTGCLRP